MNPFYDLNKRLADLSAKQDAAQLAESKQADHVAQSPLTQALNEAKADTIYVQHSNGAPQKVKLTPDMKAAGKIYVQHPSGPQTKVKIPADAKKSIKEEDLDEAGYSAKAGRAGKDLGKPGKNFEKIAKSAGAKYGSKAAGERVAGAVLNKLRHPKEDQEVEESGLQAYLGKKKYGDQGMKALQQAGRDHAGKEKMAKIRAKYDKMDEEMADEGNAFTGKLASTPKGGKFKVGNKEFKDTSSIEEGHCPACDCSPCKCNEGNAFTAALKATPKGGKFKVGGKEFTDTSSIEEGFKEMDAWLASREKEKGTGKFDRKERTLPGGMKATTYTRKHEDDVDSDDEEAKSDAPKKKGRPKGKAKGPERVTKGAWKHKGERKVKAKEGLDSDGVMMTRSTNCSSESIEHGEQSEYNDEAGMTKDSLHTIVRHAKELERALRSNENLPEWVQEKIGQIKGMMSSVTDYILSTHERDVERHTGREGISMVPEKAPPGAKAERMVKGIKKSLSKDGKLSDKDKAIAYATTWKAHNAGKVEEESTDKEDTKAERAGRKVAKDIEHDEGHKGKDDNRAERAGKKVTKDIEYDDKKDRKEKEEKVDETTTSGSVATATPSGKSSKGGMQFGKGVYEGYNNKVETMITEGMSVNISVDEQGKKSINVSATEEDAEALAQLLKMAGLNGAAKTDACPTCGSADCGCEEELDENQPDWPTNTEKSDNALQYSGGLNGPKSTGQTTIPVIAGARQRVGTMQENIDKIGMNLYKELKGFKG